MAISHALVFLDQRTSFFQSPYKISAFLSFLTIVPFYFLITLFPADLLRTPLTSQDLEYHLTLFALYYSVGIIAMFLGVYIFQKLPTSAGAAAFNLTVSGYFLVFIISYLLFLYASYIRISSAGGISFIFANLHRRAFIFSDAGPFASLVQPMAFLSGFVAVYLVSKTRKFPKTVLALVLASIFLLLSVYGGRKAPMFFLIFCFVAYSIYVSRIRFSSPLGVFFGVSLVAFFILMRQFRGSVELDDVGTFQLVIDFFRNLSYVDTYLFIMSHADSFGHWYGASFGDLLGRLGLLDLQGVRPPVDDGVYIRTMLEGYHLTPPVDFHAMIPSSLPPESFGNGYMNFGFFGVVLFFFLRGSVIGVLFRFCKVSQFSPVFLFFFLYAVFNFEITNLRIFQQILVMVPVVALVLSIKIIETLMVGATRRR